MVSLTAREHLRAAGVVAILTAAIVGALSALGWWWGHNNTSDVSLPQMQRTEDPATKEARERWRDMEASE